MDRKMNKPRLSFWQIWNMSFGFLGIQFGFGLQNANTSRIFETLGAEVEAIPILWIAAPLTGLIVQPIIGYFSDRTWHPRWGRRRPYFAIGAVLASMALCIMPNSPTLWVAAGMLWIMDASINISMEPFRAFVGDNLPSEQRTLGFATQSFFIGVGAVVASLLPYALTNWMGLANTAPEGEIAPSVKWAFYIGAAVFLLAVLWTVFNSHEYSPEEMRSFGAEEEEEEHEEWSEVRQAGEKHRQQRMGLIVTLSAAAIIFLLLQADLPKELLLLAAAVALVGLLWLASSFFIQRGRYKNGFVTILTDLLHMPPTMKQLAIVQFFSWFALFSMWIYTTAGVTRHAYDMNVTRDQASRLVSIAENIQDGDDEAENRKQERALENASAAAAGAEGYINVNTAAYFLEDRIIARESLVNDMLAIARNRDDHYADYRQKLQELQGAYADDDPANDQAIPHELTQAFLPALQEQTGKPPTYGQDVALVADLQRVQQQYNEGADWVGILFALYNGVAAIVAFFLPLLAKKTNRRVAHLICLALGGLGLLSIYFINDPTLLLVSMVGVGIAWASILAMPYAMLAGALPAEKMGYYMGVFNFFIVIPQLVAATILGFIVGNFFGGQAIYALVVGGAAFLLAGFLTLRVQDVDDPEAVAAA